MKIIRIYLYEDSEDNVLALAQDEAEEQKIRDAAEEFSRLDDIYSRFEKNNPDFEKAAEISEGGFSLFLESQGIVLPGIETISL